MKTLRIFILILFTFIVTIEVAFGQSKSGNLQTISTEVLKDKIAGGWAGKMIGVTYGGPTEYAFRKAINDAPIKWTPADLAGSNSQDDLYVQL